MLLELTDEALFAGKTYFPRHLVRRKAGSLEQFLARLDANTVHVIMESRTYLLGSSHKSVHNFGHW